MKVLIITGGNINLSFAKEYIKELDYDYLIAADKGLEAVFSLALDPDLIVGDFDSVNPEVLRRYETDPKTVESILRFKAQKDFTDTQIAVERAVKFGASEIIVLGATGNRLDHVLGNIAIMKYALRWDCTISLVDENNKITMINNNFQIEKKNQFGNYVSIVPYSKEVSNITLKGFKYNVSNETFYDNDTLGISNEIEEDVALIEFDSGFLLVIEAR